MTSASSATIGEFLEVPFLRLRDRASLQETSEYRELRHHAQNFLDHYFD